MRKKVVQSSPDIAKGIVDGIIFTSSIFMMVKGYRKGVDIFNEVVPAAVDKVHLMGLVASAGKED